VNAFSVPITVAWWSGRHLYAKTADGRTFRHTRTRFEQPAAFALKVQEKGVIDTKHWYRISLTKAA
jgi:hypothetical protein